MNYGRQPKMIKSLRRQIEQPTECDIIPLRKIDPVVWKDRLKRLDVLRDLVAKHINDERDKQKQRYDKGRLDVSFKEGDRVLRRTQPQLSAEKHISAKLAPKREVPDVIAKVLSPIMYELKFPPRRISKVHAVELLKLKTSSYDPTSQQNDSGNLKINLFSSKEHD